MKKTLFAILSITLLACSDDFQIKTPNDAFRLVQADMARKSAEGGLVLKGNVIVEVPDKLHLEADSVYIDKDKQLLTAYGTKSFTFDGAVVARKDYKGVCRYRLGEETLRLE